MSIRTVGSSIKRLEELEIIRVWRSKRKDGSYKNNLYTLLDISDWKLPGANNASSIKTQAPRAIKSASQENILPNKETNIKDTYKKEVPLKEQGNADAGIISFSDYFKKNPPNIR